MYIFLDIVPVFVVSFFLYLCTLSGLRIMLFQLLNAPQSYIFVKEIQIFFRKKADIKIFLILRQRFCEIF